MVATKIRYFFSSLSYFSLYVIGVFLYLIFSKMSLLKFCNKGTL